MMKTIKRLRSLALLSVLLAACASGPQTRADEGIPGNDSADETSQEDTATQYMLEGEYEFSMEATVNGLANMLVDDTMQSDWKGHFSIDADGQISGQGLFSYSASIYSTDDKQCGYVWQDEGEYTFIFGGTARPDKLTLPIKILTPTLQKSNTGSPQATCPDPNNSNMDIPAGYIQIHRKNLVAAIIQHIHTTLGDQIQSAEPLQVKEGTVNYAIQVTFTPALVPLTAED